MSTKEMCMIKYGLAFAPQLESFYRVRPAHDGIRAYSISVHFIARNRVMLITPAFETL